jgi:ABC-type polar amino acid transport system ATPase subunit
MDVIVHKPFSGKGPAKISIGLVSKSYQLVQHRQVIKTIVNAVKKVDIEPDQVEAELQMTQYGERVGLPVQFPDNYTIDPGDRQKLILRWGLIRWMGVD